MGVEVFVVLAVGKTAVLRPNIRGKTGDGVNDIIG
jgi:hypothetical protein